METLQDVWASKRRPTHHEALVDQVTADDGLVADFSANVVAQDRVLSRGDNDIDFFQDAPSSALSALQDQNMELSFPLCLFTDGEYQVSMENLDVFAGVFLAQYLPSCPFLREIQPQMLNWGPRYLLLSIASMGAMGLKNVEMGRQLWRMAANMLLTTITLDNRHARNMSVALSWIPLGAIGLFSDDMSTQHMTNTISGFAEAIGKRVWNKSTDINAVASSAHVSPSDERRIIFHLILLDLVRSLHLGTPATALSSWSDIGLEYPYLSVSNLTRIAIFAGSQTEWPEATNENALTMLTLILDQINTWAREMQPLLTRSSALGQAAHEGPTTSSNFQADTENLTLRLRRSLDKWARCYKDKASDDVLTLFFFCEIYLRMPQLYRTASRRGKHCDPNNEEGRTLDMENLYQATEASDEDLREASHFAWLVLEHVPPTTNMNMMTLWLPMTVYFSGLAVWRNIISNGLSRRSSSYGSPKVIKLFADKLSSLPLACCCSLAWILEELSRQGMKI